MAYRYSIYHVPKLESKLYKLGASVLGRCIVTGDELAPPPMELPPNFPEMPFPPWAGIYGFHATMVAPFRTQDSEEELVQTLKDVSQRHCAIVLESLALKIMDGGFPALTALHQPPEALSALESDLVKTFNRHRLPPTAKEWTHRGPMNFKEQSNFLNWGYPHIFEDFKFHLTVWDSFEKVTFDNVFLTEELEKHPWFLGLSKIFTKKLLLNFPIDSLSLCAQEAVGEPFRVVQEVSLAKSLSHVPLSHVD
ncbi:MAG: DUF1045 domain-containing protein [Deltaproteobacteria bacterium]|jgi:hypothetical protein|nr:DUF1045 domain-containing protein [Deltaproteobacteria bacterium]